MGELRNQIFLQFVNKSLDTVRSEFIEKHTPKKENRFLIKGITYEIGTCHIEEGDFIFEISSKIPEDLLPKQTRIERYFSEVVRRMNKSPKRPAESKMENIIHNTGEIEFKERDYVKLTYRYKESELYSFADVEKRLKHHRAKGVPIPDVPGIATPGGRLIMIIVEENMTRFIRQNVNDLNKANEAVKKLLGATATKVSPAKKPGAKKKKAAVKLKAGAKKSAKKKPAAAGARKPKKK